MKRRKRPSNGGNDGGISIESGPTIDLPPGITWPDEPSGPQIKEELEEESVY